ncbi:uncharacterized protein LOC129872252 [Solanum dulcamara]|uniref:uncharacterized protein LOC129872252 n=1 Tax=Solanum dulcamara TaxID=45834 RepID=UPI002485E59A|nr:uncharacterized protein LOC129872252 [Solanum dulcamara]
MKQREGKRVADGKKSNKIAPPPPPPASRFLSTKLTTPSLTKQEIAKYWKQKRKTEEEHFLDAIKAAARIRARNLSAEEYNHFLYSLKVDDDNMENEMVPKNISEINENMKEKRVGIKDWWTKSKYAYLNQPALKSMERHGSTYIPQLYCYKAPPPPVTSTFGIF